MKIGIDARLYNETGVGRYIRNLIRSLSAIDTDNSYIVFLLPRDIDGFVCPNERWSTVAVDIRWHSIQEQLVFPFFLNRQKLDLLHVPYFSVPVLYQGAMVTTIHDLTILKYPTGKSTTLPWIVYYGKWLVYTQIVRKAIAKSAAIITVSNTVKQEIVETYPQAERKTFVTYEGLDPVFCTVDTNPPVRQQPYFLYVGNVYPHKQAELLLQTYAVLTKEIPDLPQLIFVGKEDFFYRRLKSEIHRFGLEHVLVCMHDVSDGMLKNLYANARALLFPSLNEGFGFPALEALSQRCVPVVSDIPVFHELLGDHALYVPNGIQSWIEIVRKISTTKENRKNNNGDNYLQRFSWKQLAVQTKKIYETCIGLRQS